MTTRPKHTSAFKAWERLPCACLAPSARIALDPFSLRAALWQEYALQAYWLSVK